MSIRLDMLQAAMRAKSLLGDAADQVAHFVREQMHPDGGFKGRGDHCDLYYTLFGLEALLAMGDDFPRERVIEYLRGFGTGESLDLIHLACLLRCRADLALPSGDEKGGKGPASCIEKYRTEDGGYSVSEAVTHGSAYGCFLALGAYQDSGASQPERQRILECLEALQTPDGGYANSPAVEQGATPATAAAVTVLDALRAPVQASSIDWLFSRLHPKGGFVAMPTAPIPDLLSTATALHALRTAKAPVDEIREKCFEFIESLWTGEGAFFGSWADPGHDCEYTFYALLAMGHLSS